MWMDTIGGSMVTSSLTYLHAEGRVEAKGITGEVCNRPFLGLFFPAHNQSRPTQRQEEEIGSHFVR